MNNFEFCNPTHLVFGKGTISRLSELLPKNTKIMITMGGGSILKNGVYDQVKKAIQGFDTVEFSGIEPNPKFETLMKAVAIAKKENVGFLLAVGGGSVLDGTKFIAAALCWTQTSDPWDILLKGLEVTRAIPLGDVITLPATGSEMNGGAVISRIETKQKYAFMSEAVRPKFSIIDPETTFSLPPRQTANGIVDTFVHVCEQYMTYDVNTPLQDRMAEGVLTTLIQEAPKVLAHPDDYNVRANLFWCATVGLNGWLSVGTVQDWATHMIGHELTAEYGLDHGQTLAIVMPHLWRYSAKRKHQKLVEYARNVWNINDADTSVAIEKAIVATETFFHSLGVKTRLSDYGIDSVQAAQSVRQRFEFIGMVSGEDGCVKAQEAYDIVKTC